MNDKIAIIRIRGIRKMKPKIKKTLELLRLVKPNQCVLVNNNPKMIGMIKVVKDYVGYGSVKEETIARLLSKRGEKGGKMLKELFKKPEISEMAKKVFGGESLGKYADPVFRLRPPSRGYKNVKKAYPFGDLGKRDDMDILLRRMM